MLKINAQNHRRYIFFLLLFALIAASIFIIKSFVIDLLSSALLAYIFYPVHKKIKKVVKNGEIAAFITTFLIILLLLIPSVIFLNEMIKESASLYHSLEYRAEKGEILPDENESAVAGSISNYIKMLSEKLDLQRYIDANAMIKKSSGFLMGKVTEFVMSIPAKILDILIIFFVLFYLFVDGEHIKERISTILFINDDHNQEVIKTLSDVIYGAVYGLLFVAFLEAIIATVIFYALGIESALILGVIIFVTAILPIIGAGIVWIPLAIYSLISGDILTGVIIIIMGVFISGYLDTYLKPKIIGNRAKIHPIFVFLGVIGGASLFGLAGVILGPLTLAVLYAFIKIYQKEIKS